MVTLGNAVLVLSELVHIKWAAYPGFGDDVTGDDISLVLEVRTPSGWPEARPLRSAHGTPGLHVSRCDPRASLLLFQAVTFFPFLFIFLASIASSELPLSLLHPKPKPPLFVLFCSHTKALFLLFPNSVKSFIHFFFESWHILLFTSCGVMHIVSVLCVHI